MRAAEMSPMFAFAGRGRPPGVPNRVTTQLKEAILTAADIAGQIARRMQIEEAIRSEMPDADEKAVDRAVKLAIREQGEGNAIDYLVLLAIQEPKSYAALLGRVLPLQIAGDSDNPITVVHEIITSLDGQTRALPSQTLPAEYVRTIAAE